MHIAFLMSFVVLQSCTHKTSEKRLQEKQAQARPRLASYGSDLFFNDLVIKPQDKIYQPDQFFFKKCRIYDRQLYPAMNIWECEGGP